MERERGVNTPGREDRMQLKIEPHSEEFLERRVKKGSTNWQLYWGLLNSMKLSEYFRVMMVKRNSVEVFVRDALSTRQPDNFF